MKKTIIILIQIIFLLILLISCGKEANQEAEPCFTTEYETYEAGEYIYLQNCSSFSDSYFWDFNNGKTSNVANPIISYSEPGTYEIALTAYGKYNENTTYLTVNITPSTDLNILVMLNASKTPVDNCKVILYENKTDWENYNNEIVKGFTDSEGNINFYYLNPKQYYISAEKLANRTGKYSNNNLINTTPILTPNTTNYLDIYIEYIGVVTGAKTYKIVEVKKGNPNNPLRIKSASKERISARKKRKHVEY